MLLTYIYILYIDIVPDIPHIGESKNNIGPSGGPKCMHMQELHSHHPELVTDQLTPESWVSADNDIETSGVITDAEIISEIHSGHNEQDDNDSDGDDISDEPQPCPTATEVHSALRVIQRYALFVDSDDIGVLATKLSSAVSTASLQQKVQTIIIVIISCTLC